MRIERGKEGKRGRMERDRKENGRKEKEGQEEKR